MYEDIVAALQNINKRLLALEAESPLRKQADLIKQQAETMRLISKSLEGLEAAVERGVRREGDDK